MSTLNVSNITDGTTTVGTSYVVNGAAKAWLNFNQATPVVEDSFNISSVTDNTLGQFSPQFTNNMNNNDYSITATASRAGAGNARTNFTYDNIATGSFKGFTYEIYSGDEYRDVPSGSTIHGDLA